MLNKDIKIKKHTLFFLFALAIFSQVTIAHAGSVSFMSPGDSSFTVPAGVTQILVSASGPGGNGDSTLFGTSGGGGGGGGASVINKIYNVVPGTTYPVVVGSNADRRNTALGSLFSLSAGSNASGAIGGAGGYADSLGINVSGGDGAPWDFGYDCPSGLCFNPAGLGGVGGSTILGSASWWQTCNSTICNNVPNSTLGAGGTGASMSYEPVSGGTRYDNQPGLGGDGFMQIFWVDPSVGTINLSSNLPAATWTLTGPTNLAGVSGLPQTYNNLPSGMYTMVWGVVPGYNLPAPTSLFLPPNGTIDFFGVYTMFAIVPSVNLNFAE